MASSKRVSILSKHLAPQAAAGQEIEEVYIVGVSRTALGCFGGALKDKTAPELGSAAIIAALKNGGVSPDAVNEVFMGNVLSANIGQAPAKQAQLGAGIPDSVPATTVNKVCASGMKAVMFGAQSIMLGINHCVVAGGMESMSNAPYYAPNQRWGNKLGHVSMVDSCIKDGLWDPYDNAHMGMCAELCADTFSFDRAAQDGFALESYRRAQAAIKEGKFAKETVPVPLKKKGSHTTDEQVRSRRRPFHTVSHPQPLQQHGTHSSVKLPSSPLTLTMDAGQQALPGKDGQDRTCIQKRRHRHCWQRLPTQRRCGGARTHERVQDEAAGAQAARQGPWLRRCCQGTAGVHHGTGPGNPKSAGPRWSEPERR